MWIELVDRFSALNDGFVEGLELSEEKHFKFVVIVEYVSIEESFEEADEGWIDFKLVGG